MAAYLGDISCMIKINIAFVLVSLRYKQFEHLRYLLHSKQYETYPWNYIQNDLT
jgi:hypothetical protein